MITKTDKANENRIGPKVSIVIASWNIPEDYLQNCLKSVRKQSYPNIEVILVDDGSKPESAKLIDELSKQDGRILVFHQENKGVSAARNKGTELCSGDYIAYLDADDSLTPWFLEQAVSAALQNNADVVYGMVRGVISEGIREYSSKLPVPSCRFLSAGDDWLKKHQVGKVYKQGSVFFGRGPCARLIRAELAKEVSFSEEVTVGEDILWNLDLLKAAEVKVVTSGIWYNYFTRPDSVTNRFDPEIESKLKPFYVRFSNYREFVGDDNYRSRILCDLVNYIFALNTGHPLNPASFFVRWRGFAQACRSYPWNEVAGLRLSHQDSFRDGLKVFLYKTGLLFLAESLVKHIRRVRASKEKEE